MSPFHPVCYTQAHGWRSIESPRKGEFGTADHKGKPLIPLSWQESPVGSRVFSPKPTGATSAHGVAKEQGRAEGGISEMQGRGKHQPNKPFCKAWAHRPRIKPVQRTAQEGPSIFFGAWTQKQAAGQGPGLMRLGAFETLR